MPVKIPDGLPARKVLEQEGVLVIPQSRAFVQDIRPLRVAIVNLMPLKSVTETQLLRLLSGSPLQVSVTFLALSSRQRKNTPPEHLARFYKSFAEVRQERFDCLIVTGAPVETLPFTEVAYWDKLRELLDWSLSHVYSSLHLCWGAQAALYHYYGIEKHLLPRKLSGIFAHIVAEERNALLQGFDRRFFAPHSRYTEVRREDIRKVSPLCLLAESRTAGVYLAARRDGRQVFVTGHPEYDKLTLREEYERDVANCVPVSLPVNYFPGNNPRKAPVVSWRGHAHLLFTNWLNDVYQHAPFDLNELKPP